MENQHLIPSYLSNILRQNRLNYKESDANQNAYDNALGCCRNRSLLVDFFIMTSLNPIALNGPRLPWNRWPLSRGIYGHVAVEYSGSYFSKERLHP